MNRFFVPFGVSELFIRVELEKKDKVAYFLFDPLKRLRSSGCAADSKRFDLLLEQDDHHICYGTWSLCVLSRSCGEDIECEIFVDYCRKKVNPKWCKGEFHTHTVRSDGSWTVEELAFRLKELDVEFFFVTDHNTFGIDKPLRFKDIVAFPGIELTLHGGHIVVLDPDEKLNFRELSKYICGIAHPFFPKTESCPDCPFEKPWEYDFVEVWNSDLEEDPQFYNDQALKIYKDLVGKRYLSPLAAGDIHNENSLRYWLPSFVYLPDLTLECVLNSVVEGLIIVGHIPSISESCHQGILMFVDGSMSENLSRCDWQNIKQFEIRDRNGKLISYANFKKPISKYLE